MKTDISTEVCVILPSHITFGVLASVSIVSPSPYTVSMFPPLRAFTLNVYSLFPVRSPTAYKVAVTVPHSSSVCQAGDVVMVPSDCTNLLVVVSYIANSVCTGFMFVLRSISTVLPVMFEITGAPGILASVQKSSVSP